MTLTQDVHRCTGLGLEWRRRKPTHAKQLNMPRNICTATKLEVNGVYPVGVNDDEVLVSFFEAVAKPARRMAKLNSQAQRSKCCVPEK